MSQFFLLFFIVISFVMGYIRGRNTSDKICDELLAEKDTEIFIHMLQTDDALERIAKLKVEIQQLKDGNSGNI